MPLLESNHEFNHNLLEYRAIEFIQTGRPADALRIYLHMADGDPSLDAGYLGEKIAQCYEAIGDLHAAKYWYGRAVEEGAGVRTDSIEGRKRLAEIGIGYLIPDKDLKISVQDLLDLKNPK